MDDFVAYSTFPNFASFIIDGHNHCFLNNEKLFTITSEGKNNYKKGQGGPTSLLHFMNQIPPPSGTFLKPVCHGNKKYNHERLRTSECPIQLVGNLWNAP